MELTAKQQAELREALLAAFTLDELKMMVQDELSVNLDTITTNSNLRTVVFELIQWVIRMGREADLVYGAQRANPGNPRLRAFVSSIGADPPTTGSVDRVREVLAACARRAIFARMHAQL